MAKKSLFFVSTLILLVLSLFFQSCSSNNDKEPEDVGKYLTPQERAAEIFGINLEEYDCLISDSRIRFEGLFIFPCIKRKDNSLFLGVCERYDIDNSPFDSPKIIFKDNQVRLNPEVKVQYYENAYNLKPQDVECQIIQADDNLVLLLYVVYSGPEDLKRYAPFFYFYDGKTVHVTKHDIVEDTNKYKLPKLSENTYFVTYSNCIHFEYGGNMTYIKRIDLESGDTLWETSMEISKDLPSSGRCTYIVEKGATNWKVSVKVVSIDGKTGTDTFYLNPEDGSCSK